MHKARWAVCQVEELICHKRPWRDDHWRGRDDTSSIAYGSAPPARHYTSDGLQAKGDPVRSARGRAIGQKGLASALYVLEGRCDESCRLSFLLEQPRSNVSRRPLLGTAYWGYFRNARTAAVPAIFSIPSLLVLPSYTTKPSELFSKVIFPC